MRECAWGEQASARKCPTCDGEIHDHITELNLAQELREREQDSDEDEPRVQHHRTAKLLCSYYLA